MKKKIIALILALVTVLFCGCGAAGSAASYVANELLDNDEEDDASGVAIVEDCKIDEITQSSVSFSYKVRNLTDEDMVGISVYFQLLDANGDAVANTSRYVENIMAGQAVWSKNGSVYDVDINEVDCIAFTGCRISYGSTSSPVHPMAETTYFYIKDMREDIEDSQEILALGDVVFTDTAEILLKSVNFSDSVSGYRSSGSIYLTEQEIKPSSTEQTFALLNISIKNTGKEQIDEAHDILDVKINYSDGYIYESSNVTCYLIDTKQNVRQFGSNYSKGTVMRIPPLTSEDYLLVIPVAKAVGDDTSSPLQVSFLFPNNSGTQEFIYKIR